MNIDDALYDDSLYRELSGDPGALCMHAAEVNQCMRKTVVLPNGGIAIRCITPHGTGKCDKTIASTETRDGQVRFKIMLNTREQRRKKPKMLIEEEENEKREKRLERQDIRDYLLGMCPQCGTFHGFCFEEIARVLGFADCEFALRTRLTGGNYLRKTPEFLAGGFLAVFVTRKDNLWQSDHRIGETAFFYYEDGEDDPERESVWYDEDEEGTAE